MTEVESRIFFSNGIQYILKWVAERHHQLLPKKLSNKLQSYYEFLCSSNYPDHIFKSDQYTRCSSFRIKGLEKNAQKIISLKLIRYGLVDLIDKDGNVSSENKYAEHILKIPKMTAAWYSIFYALNNKNPGHEPILAKILELNPLALSTEISIWSSTYPALMQNILPKTQFLCMARTIFTGHIDLLLYDPVGKNIIVADYKPENHFLRSLPQVATYGLAIKKILNTERVKCMSFSKDQAWIYDPEIIRNELLELIRYYGNPPLEWRAIVLGIE